MLYTKCAAILVLLARATTEPYGGLTGAPKVNPLKDGCWKNLTLAAVAKRALLICSSHGAKMNDGKPTGIALQEAAAPYYVYQDAGMEVDIASILGGQVPIGEKTPTPSQIRYYTDKTFKHKLSMSKRIEDVDFEAYDAVFMVGGWGAAYDLGYSTTLGRNVAAALASGKPLVASTCHGVLGFVLANRSDGTPWLKGMTVTGVTDAQIHKLGVANQTPMHPEEELKKLGANYQSMAGAGLRGDVGATSVSVDERGPVVVTGQNQNSACVAAQRQLLFLASAQTPGVFAWVPTASCKSPLKVCYEGSEFDVLHVAKTDPVNLCRYGHHAEIRNGTCASFGYSTQFKTPFGKLVHDPIFRKVKIFKSDSTDVFV